MYTIYTVQAALVQRSVMSCDASRAIRGRSLRSDHVVVTGAPWPLAGSSWRGPPWWRRGPAGPSSPARAARARWRHASRTPRNTRRAAETPARPGPPWCPRPGPAPAFDWMWPRPRTRSDALAATCCLSLEPRMTEWLGRAGNVGPSTRQIKI